MGDMELDDDEYDESDGDESDAEEGEVRAPRMKTVGAQTGVCGKLARKSNPVPHVCNGWVTPQPVYE